MFCKLCHIGIYKSTDTLNLQSGGVLLRGGCTELSQNIETIENQIEDEDDVRHQGAKSQQNRIIGELAKSIGLKKNINKGEH